MNATLARLGEILRGEKGRRRLLVAFAAGAVSALGFAPINAFPLLLLGYAVLPLLLDGAGPKNFRTGAAIGWAFGFGQFLIGLHWIGYPFLVDPHNHGWQLPFAVLFMTGGLALFPCLACAAAACFWKPGSSRILVLAVCLGASEWLRGHIFTGFPWNLAAYGWGASLEILQSTALWGAYGLTLLTILLATSLADLFVQKAWRLPAFMLLLFAALWAAGAMRLSVNPTTFVEGISLRLVQPNIPQPEKANRQYLERNWRRLIDLSRAGGMIAPTHIIWPEAALVSLPQGGLEELRALIGPSHVLITGAVRAAPGQDGQLKYFNSLYVLSSDTTLAYDKFHLVPFGEYLPFARELNALGLSKLTAGNVDFSPGNGPRTLAIPHAPPAGPLICYEAIFPDDVVGATRPDWFVNVTNDAWFGPWAGPRQHLVSARVRAIEEGIPVVRAANTGISAVIDGTGRVVSSLALNQTGVLNASLPKVLSLTVYGQYGDLVFLILLLLCVVGAGVSGRK
jgi:apolipoprotein N-acyltransferase